MVEAMRHQDRNMNEIDQGPSVHHLTRPKYRPDIDGLRAIAVLAVVGFHAFPGWVTGGFVGVDMFFVISGFLISTIIFSSLERGVFSFREFYSRRVRRIFPALSIVLAACLVLGWNSMLGDEFGQLGKHIAAGSAFISNFVLWNESGYFDASADSKPLLHLWSLGIEEQFYIVWPLLLYLAWRRKLNLMLLTLIIVFASLYLNVNSVNRHAVATFYSPASRFWELLFGSALAYVATVGGTLGRDARRGLAVSFRTAALDNPNVRNVLSALGLVLIAYPVFGMTKDWAFPGWWAILPCAGAVSLIAAGPDAWINRRILSNRVLVFFGLISFPLYLWHWPLISFASIVEAEALNRRVRIAAVIISVLLAWLTYRFIETPLRFGGHSRKKVVALCLAMAILGGLGTLAWAGVILPVSSSLGLEKIVKARGEWEYPGPNFKAFDYEGVAFFQRGSGRASQTLYMGDSNMEQYGPRIDRVISRLPEQANTAVFAALGACAPIPGVVDKQKPECADFVTRAVDYATKTPQVNTVVVGAQWFAYFSGATPHHYAFEDGVRSWRLGVDTEGSERAYRSLETMLATLRASGKSVFLVLNIPMGPAMNPKNLVKRSVSSLGFSIQTGGMVMSDLLGTHNYGDIRQRLLALARQSGAIAIDPLDHLCFEGVCPSMTADGEPIYKDNAHIRPLYVKEHVTFLDRTLH
jgi:peptidoglycan/LPS O-acetylase OafA/YrhL